jgi:uncharacterized protein (TIGR02996 family)
VADEATFLDGLWADPEDDELRLVFADWLEEHGDPRAELLRALVALRQAADASRRAELAARIGELRAGVDAAWLAAAVRWWAEDEVREAVFRQTLDGGVHADTSCFLQAADRKDPSPEVLARLLARGHAVRPASARTGAGVTLTAGEITWLDRAKCTVHGSIYHGPLSARGHVWTVEALGPEWAVTHLQHTWIS